MKLLVLGGTIFLGRHLVEAALARGHEVSLFHRGRHGAELFPEAEHLFGDRGGELGALAGRRWDVVVDTSAYVPRVARRSAELLRDAAEHYTFVSTVSVYGAVPGPVREDAPLRALADPTAETMDGGSYGALKALCERAVEECFPGRALVVRPGIIVGPHDPTERFTYWARRVARGGEVLAPGSGDQRVEVIDVRDLAEWMLRMAERRAAGVYNAVGPRGKLTFWAWLESCRLATESGARLTWVDEEFLREQGVEPMEDLPFWFPEGDPEMAGAFHTDAQRALAEGLTYRPLAETVRDTVEWDRGLPEEVKGRTGLSREREAALLAAWHAREREGRRAGSPR
ncbi:MAG: NAD-dependent epimerase/dehydratase family protein [Gemmatimonadetes bacterium]|nr:NAD-dependent epimerase/dehydratase family protein [Gemmatimonadota bacterium]